MPSVNPAYQAPVMAFFDAAQQPLGLFVNPPFSNTGNNPYTKADSKTSVQAPLTGFAITAADGTRWLQLTPAGTLAAGTVTFPVSTNLIDGQEFLIGSTQTITALTLAGNGSTISNAVTTLAAGAAVKYKYVAAAATWYRVQ